MFLIRKFLYFCYPYHKNIITMDTVELVFKTFAEAGKPLKSGEVAEMAGLDKKEVDKAIKKLKSEEKIVSPKRCYYEAKKA